jgi:cardiolipin synthase
MHPAPRTDWVTVPNLISFGRLLATPFLCWSIVSGPRLLAVLLFVAMGVSDFLDGQIARATGNVSELGIVLDPTSDRIVIGATVITLIATGSVNVWLALAVLVREAAVSGTFVALARSGLERPAVKFIGKAATAVLFVALGFLILDGGAGHAVGIWMFALGAVLYYVAAFRYGQDLVKAISKRRAEPRDRSAEGMP